MGDKRLLIDRSNGSVGLHLEESADGKGWVVKGEFGLADIPTANKRIYPRTLWEREIKKIKGMMEAGTVYMHPKHPADGKTDLMETCGLMRKLEIMPDNQVIGEAIILDNDKGRHLMSIYKAGGRIGVSSRGMGSTRMGEDGVEIVDDDYSYMTHDFVADPAVKTSYPDLKTEQNNQLASEPVVEGESVMAITEADVQAKLDEQKAVYEQKLTEQATQLKEEADKEKELSLADAAGALTKETEKAKEDAEKKDAEIVALKAKVESQQKEIDSLVLGAKEITESARRLGIRLQFERAMSETDEKETLQEELGDIKQYKTMEALSEAVKKAKKKIHEKKKAKLAFKKKMEDVEKKHAAEKKALEEQALKSAQEAEASKKALLESLREKNVLAAKNYVESRVQGNPNGQKIRNLCEGVTDRSKIDEIVGHFSIDEQASREYNLVQNRLAKLDAVAQSKKSLVEDQIASEGASVKTAVGVDAEIADVTR